MKCCTKLETAKERYPIVFQGHPSNFKVTRCKTSPILTQIGRFRSIGQSQLSNPSDLPSSVSDLIFCYDVLRKYFQCPFYLPTQSAVTYNKKCYFLLLCSFGDEWAPLIPPFPWATYQPPTIGRQYITIKWSLLEILFKIKTSEGILFRPLLTREWLW